MNSSVPSTKHSKVYEILNLLIPENYDVLVAELFEMIFECPDVLLHVAVWIITKAFENPDRMTLYVDLCKTLSEVAADETTRVRESFRILLVKQCKVEFLKAVEKERKILTSGPIQRPYRDYHEVQIIVELFNADILDYNFIYECIQALFGDENQKENVEQLCDLLNLICGKMYRENLTPNLVERAMDRLTSLATYEKERLSQDEIGKIWQMNDLVCNNSRWYGLLRKNNVETIEEATDDTLNDQREEVVDEQADESWD